MQNQQPFARKFSVPAALNGRGPRSERLNAAPSSEEPWTQYDGLGPVHQGGRGPRGNNNNWRSGGGGGGGGHNNRQRQGKNSRMMDNRRMPPSSAGQKRKPSPSMALDHRDAIDDKFLDETFGILKREDLPKAPRTIWEAPKNFLWESKYIQPSSTFLAQHGGWFRCTIICRFAGRDPITAVGEAQTKVRSKILDCIDGLS